MMKTKLRIFALIICSLICVFSFAACNNSNPSGESTILGNPEGYKDILYPDLDSDDYTAFKNRVEAFAAYFAEYSYADSEKQENFTVSPISVYMALALSAECANGDTSQEILGALGVTHQQLKTHFSALYSSLDKEYKTYDGETTGLLKLTNSIWVNEGTPVKQPCIGSLSSDYYAYSYYADFENNNEQANQAVRDFVKEQTRGLIDKDFELSEKTLFALINTLYLKTIWGAGGDDLPFAKDTYNFTAKDGSVKNIQLLQGYYADGRAVEFDDFTTFFTRTYDGYKIKFILPKDGYSVDEVFTAKNIASVNAITDYGAFNKSQTKKYETRVLFPEYKCKYDKDIKKILQDKFGIDLFFKSSEFYSPSCDFSNLSYEPCHCDKIQHVTDLTVNRTGIEGAAVTAVAMGADGAIGDQIEIVRNDFIVNKAFGFIITDSQNTTLFSGVVNDI